METALKVFSFLCLLISNISIILVLLRQYFPDLSPECQPVFMGIGGFSAVTHAFLTGLEYFGGGSSTFMAFLIALGVFVCAGYLTLSECIQMHHDAGILRNKKKHRGFFADL